MCHPWLATGVIAFVAVVLAHEIGPIVRDRGRNGSRLESGFLGQRLRDWFRGRVRPVAAATIRLGVTPNAITLSQLAASVICGIAYAHGWMFTAGWILITCGTLDVLDGEVARGQHIDGPRGAFIDSVVDRYSESAVYIGLVAFYRDTWVLWAVLTAWAGSFLVSYARARAEGVGVDCREGLAQRPERYVILGVTSLVSSLSGHIACHHGGHALVAAGICLLAVLSNLTALQRTRATLRKLA